MSFLQTQPRVAIVHYWLVGLRGGERVVEELCKMYPEADIYTHAFIPERVAGTFAGHTVTTTFIDRLPFKEHLLDWYLPLMPFALRHLDLRAYDLVITSESGPAKGVRTATAALHVCYCHSPMRYVWDLQGHYLEHAGPAKRLAMRAVTPYLRSWDQATAQLPDVIIANSTHTQRRIAKFWGRKATVIHPPVDIVRFREAAATVIPGEYFLCAGQLMSYKRIDVAVDAFSSLGLPLVVAGAGPELADLKRRAGPNITFAGWRSDEALALLIAGCRALIFPGEEDFGIVPVEAMAAGRPVIAFGHGGVLDTLIEGVTGMTFSPQTPTALAQAVRSFERRAPAFDSHAIGLQASQFDRRHFRDRFKAVVDAHLAGRCEVVGGEGGQRPRAERTPSRSAFRRPPW